MKTKISAMVKARKIVVLVLCAVLVCGSLYACGQSDPVAPSGSSQPPPSGSSQPPPSSTASQPVDSGGEQPGDSGYPAASELPPYKFGFLIWGTTDALGASVKKNMDYLVKEFNCEIEFVKCLTAEDYVSATETLVQKGVDGIFSLGKLG